MSGYFINGTCISGSCQSVNWITQPIKIIIATILLSAIIFFSTLLYKYIKIFKSPKEGSKFVMSKQNSSLSQPLETSLK